jgi:phosphatidylinositol glycan class K
LSSVSLSTVIADEYAINARNPFKNRMHAEGIHRTGWYNNQTEIDYRGSDVTVQMFMDALLGQAPKSLNNLNGESNLMIYLTGHGGDQFFKFQDEVRGMHAKSLQMT